MSSLGVPAPLHRETPPPDGVPRDGTFPRSLHVRGAPQTLAHSGDPLRVVARWGKGLLPGGLDPNERYRVRMVTDRFNDTEEFAGTEAEQQRADRHCDVGAGEAAIAKRLSAWASEKDEDGLRNQAPQRCSTISATPNRDEHPELVGTAPYSVVDVMKSTMASLSNPSLQLASDRFAMCVILSSGPRRRTSPHLGDGKPGCPLLGSWTESSDQRRSSETRR